MVKGGFENALDLLTVIADPVKYQGLLEGIRKEASALEKVRIDVMGVGDAQQYLKDAEELKTEAKMLLDKAKEQAAQVEADARIKADNLKREAEQLLAERKEALAKAKVLKTQYEEELAAFKTLEETLVKKTQDLEKEREYFANLKAEYEAKKAKLLNALS